MRHIPKNRKAWWMFGRDETGPVFLLGFSSQHERDLRYGQIQSCGTSWVHMGRTSTRTTEERARKYLSERFPFAEIVSAEDPMTNDEIADAYDAQVESRIP